METPLAQCAVNAVQEAGIMSLRQIQVSKLGDRVWRGEAAWCSVLRTCTRAPPVGSSCQHAWIH